MKPIAVVALAVSITMFIFELLGYPPTPSELVGEPSRQTTCHKWALDNAYRLSDRIDTTYEFTILFDACMVETGAVRP